jgi:hypothetical protein
VPWWLAAVLKCGGWLRSKDVNSLLISSRASSCSSPSSSSSSPPVLAATLSEFLRVARISFVPYRTRRPPTLPHNLFAGRLPTHPSRPPKCLRESTLPVPGHRMASPRPRLTEMTPTALALVHQATSRARQTQTIQSRKSGHTRPKWKTGSTSTPSRYAPISLQLAVFSSSSPSSRMPSAS